MRINLLIFLNLLLSFSVFPPSFAQNLTEDLLLFSLLKADLELDKQTPHTVSTKLINLDNNIETHRVVLQHSGVGEVHLLLKGPRGFRNSENKFEAIMIVSGFFTGEKSVHLINKLSNKILIGFEYPYKLSDFQKYPAHLLHFLHKTPGQIALGLSWLSRQSWLAPDGISVMGVSLGGFFLPAALHLGQSMGVRLKSTIFVCTGTDIHSILYENLKSHIPPNNLDALIKSILLLTKLVHPQSHLPYLKGPFLVIQTADDTVIPKTAQDNLWQLLPLQKKQIILNGPHINADQKELISEVQQIIIDQN